MPERGDRPKSRIRPNSGDPRGVASGYDSSDVPDFHIPPVNLESVDRSVMGLFDSTIEFQVSTRANKTVKVPVVFATGERFALLNRNKPIRDRAGALILPMISIRRTGVEQTDADMTGRGINQHTGDLTICRRLSAKDREYQNLINRLGLRGQDGLTEPGVSDTDYSVGELADDPRIQRGELLTPDLGNNIYEFIVIPQPQFYTATYEIVFWTSYTQQMNQMIERLMGAQLPQGRCFRLDTPEGYWFVGFVSEAKTSQDNFTDFSEQTRVIKYSFTLDVKAYLLIADGPGESTAIRRYTSAPRVEFDLRGFNEGDPALDPALAADPDTQLTLEGPPAAPRDQFSSREQIERSGVKKVTNPFSKTGSQEYARVLQKNEKVGETVYRGELPIEFDR